MFCENCGEKISKDDAFCNNCGSPVKKEESSDTTNEVKQESVQTEVVANSTEEATKVEEEKTIESVEPVVNNNSKGDNIKKGSTGKVMLVILAIFIVLAAIGTGLYFFLFKDKNEKSIDAIQKAVENMKDLNSYTMVVKGDIATKGSDSFTASLDWETNFDVKNKIAKMNVKVSYSGVEIELPAYVDFSDSDNGLIYFKLPAMIAQTDEWTKISLGTIDELIGESINDVDDNKIDLDEFNEKIKDIDFIQKKKSDISGSEYYEITINEEIMKEIAKANEDLEISDSDIEEMQLGDGFIIGIYIDKKENYISKISIDMKDYVNNLADGETEFEKLVMSIEYKDINKVSEITIPSDAKKAEEISLNEIFGNNNIIPDIDDNDLIDDDWDLDNEDYVDDYSVTEYGYKVKYNMPKGFEASSVNDDDFKIYHSDDLDVTISNYWDSKEERFEDIEFDKEYYEKSDYYKNVKLSDEKTIKVNGKEFVYRELSYESSYSKYYEATVCYQLDDDHVYRVEYEKSGNPITEDELKLFLDITISKN